MLFQQTLLHPGFDRRSLTTRRNLKGLGGSRKISVWLRFKTLNRTSRPYGGDDRSQLNRTHPPESITPSVGDGKWIHRTFTKKLHNCNITPLKIPLVSNRRKDDVVAWRGATAICNQARISLLFSKSLWLYSYFMWKGFSCFIVLEL